LVQRVSTVVGGGIERVTWDLDAALAVTGAPAVLRALLARRLAAAGGADAVVVGAKELGRVDPPIPKVDVTNDFKLSVFKDGGVELKYGDPDGIAGLVVNINKEGVLGFDIRAAQNHPLYDASGTDMFASAMQRLGNEGIQVNLNPWGLGGGY